MRVRLTGDAAEKLKEVREFINDERRTVSRIIGIEVVKGVQRNIRQSKDSSGRPYKPLKYRKGTPLRDKGLYLNSWVYKLRPGGVRVGTNKIQGPLQNFGGTVRPKRGKYLAIPVGDGSVRLVKQVVIPAREHAYISDETLAAIQKRFDALLRRIDP